MNLIDAWPVLLSCRHIDALSEPLCSALSLPDGHHSVALMTCDQDDALYVALDHATKFADVHVAFGASFYAGAKHGSGPFSGEVLGALSGKDPDIVQEGVWAVREALQHVRFQTLPGTPLFASSQPAFLAHVIGETGHYLAPQANIAVGDPMAYLIAPPAEAIIAVDAALKAAPVALAKWIKPPSETNFAGAFLTGDLADLNSAKDAFVEAIADFVKAPLKAARRPDRLRR